MLVKKRCVSRFIFVLFTGLFVQTFVVPMSYAMQPQPVASGNSGNPSQELTVFDRLKFSAQGVLRTAMDNKEITGALLSNVLNMKYYGLSTVASSGLQLVPQFQQVWYGNEEVQGDIVELIRAELKNLKIPDWETLPIRKKKGNFSVQGLSFNALIVHPTNKCIYVDEQFLRAQNPEMRTFIIKTALRHYLNGTFRKISLAQLTFAGIGMYVIPKANEFIKNVVHRGIDNLLSRFEDSDTVDNSQALVPISQSSGYLKGLLPDVSIRGVLNMVVTMGTLWAWNKAQDAALNTYVRSKQKGYDKKEVGNDKKKAQRLVGALATHAKNNSQDHRPDPLQERVCALIEDELSEEWNQLKSEYNNRDNLQKNKIEGLIGKLTIFFHKLPQSDPRKDEAQDMINADGSKGLVNHPNLAQ